MARVRKTKKQKQVADTRFTQAPSQTINPSFNYTPSIAAEKPKAVNNYASATSSFDYAYVGHDLRKTIIVTCAIVIAELVLFFLM